MYDDFAAVYDSLMDDFDYPKWAEYYVELIRRAGVEPKRMAECGCGTGSMTVEFADMGVRVTGMDISPDMLRIAGQKVNFAGEVDQVSVADPVSAELAALRSEVEELKKAL